MLQIRDFDPRSEFFHPGSSFFHPGSGFFHPGFGFSVLDPGSKRHRIPEPGSESATLNWPRFKVFLTQKIVTKPGNVIRDVYPVSWIPDPNFFPSRIQGSKSHWIPDPDPQHCWVKVYISTYCFSWSSYTNHNVSTYINYCWLVILLCCIFTVTRILSMGSRIR